MESTSERGAGTPCLGQLFTINYQYAGKQNKAQRACVGINKMQSLTQIISHLPHFGRHYVYAGDFVKFLNLNKAKVKVLY